MRKFLVLSSILISINVFAVSDKEINSLKELVKILNAY